MTEVGVRQVPLSAVQKDWLERAWSNIDTERMAQLNLQMANIPSPTGEERQLAEFMAAYMADFGLDAFYQPIDEKQGNAVGRLKGSGGGPELLFYSPLDTIYTGSPSEDSPGVASFEEPYMKSKGVMDSGNVVGLGAENPKGYATCLVSAVEAVARANIPLSGTIIVGLGAGAMPSNKRPGLERFNIGHGSGCDFMLQQGVRADFAVIAKPFYFVSWEEPGLCWFKVTIRGIPGYVGVRHLMRYKNPISDAAKVITALEEWFAEYAQKNISALVAPQGVIGAMQAGWPYKPSFTPASCNLFIDLRTSPRMDPMDAKRQFGAALERIKAAHPEIELDWEMIVAIPGTSTDPENWIVQSCMRAWEYVEGAKHPSPISHGGATDANTLRRWGIPTARLGMPPLHDARYDDLPFMMGVSSISGMTQLTKCLIYAIIDTCTRTTEEIAAPN
jgi:acetylornithine deacetylase/succinyl-diaminopimelate desuccinylase-like protein